ncbi:MAG: phytoene desaturase family protein [Candidatus Binataceae bacterium]
MTGGGDPGGSARSYPPRDSRGEHDAIVIGAGLNGLVAALYLAQAGWKVLVLERNPKIGGAVMSGEITLPGFVHDLYATNQNLFAGSPVYNEFRRDLERHGLFLVRSDKPNCNVFPDRSRIPMYRGAERMLDVLRRHNPADAEGWSELGGHFEAFHRSLIRLIGTPMPSRQALWILLKAIRTEGLDECRKLMQIVLSSTRQLGETYFRSSEMRSLFAVWGMHLDFGPDVTGGGMFPFLETFSDVENGISIAKGGASKIVDSIAALLCERGGEIRINTEVDRVLIENGRAIGVVLTDGAAIKARRAVIANVTPGPLFGRLLRDSGFAPALRRSISGYTYGPGTMMVHLALSAKPQWRAGGDTTEFAYVHIAPYVEDLDLAYSQSVNGLLPASPLLIVGQTSAVDPTRAKDGQILWIQVRTLPSRIRGDALGTIAAANWDDAREPYADRVIEKLEQYAPGIRKLILNRVAWSPADLERANPNLSGGDSIGGSHHLAQNFFFRPIPGWSRYRTPLKRLYMCGAGTWPGAGAHGISGYLCAREVLHPGILSGIRRLALR